MKNYRSLLEELRGLGERRCKNCDYFIRAKGEKGQEIFICPSKEGADGEVFVVKEEGCCRNFFVRRGFRPEVEQPSNRSFRIIPLTKGKVTIVDADVYEELNRYSWYACRRKNGYYARCESKDKKIYMHRLIMKPAEGSVVDHIDHNTLNNTRGNLRICSLCENSYNSRPRSKVSGYKGVVRAKSGKWYARLYKGGRVFYGGLFEKVEEAARSYDKMAKEEFGEYACLNFPGENRG